MKPSTLILASLLLATPLAAQTAAADSALLDELRSGDRYTAPSVVLLVEPGTLSPGEAERFALAMSRGVEAIAGVLGQGLDRERYLTDTLHVVVSPRVTISHVYGAYEHMAHPKPYLFLSPEKVRDGSAPYLHEATHLLAWRFGSLSLREGFASYVESRVSAALGVPSPALFGITDTLAADRRAAELLTTPAGQHVLPHIGANGTPPAEVTSSGDRRSRAAFYVLSHSFVQYLHRQLGEVFAEVYAAEDPAAHIRGRTGRPMTEWRESWARSLRG